jgi:hypothetical protein
MRRALAFALLCLPLRVGATPESDALIGEGVELRRKQKDADALERFQRALAIEATPRVRAQIGFAEQALGRWVEAERDLAAALSTGEDTWIVKNRSALERALATVGEHLGTLEVSGTPAGAAVRIGGEPVGTLPLARGLRVPAGSAALEVSADQHAAAQRTVLVHAGKISRERIDLVRAEATLTVQAAPPIRTLRPHRPVLWIGGWTLLGVGLGAVAVLGGGGAALYQTSADRWNADSCVGAGLTRAETCGAEHDRAVLGQRLEISGFVLGGALAVAGVGLLAADAAQRRGAR